MIGLMELAMACSCGGPDVHLVAIAPEFVAIALTDPSLSGEVVLESVASGEELVLTRPNKVFVSGSTRTGIFRVDIEPGTYRAVIRPFVPRPGVHRSEALVLEVLKPVAGPPVKPAFVTAGQCSTSGWRVGVLHTGAWFFGTAEEGWLGVVQASSGGVLHIRQDLPCFPALPATVTSPGLDGLAVAARADGRLVASTVALDLSTSPVLVGSSRGPTLTSSGLESGHEQVLADIGYCLGRGTAYLNDAVGSVTYEAGAAETRLEPDLGDVADCISDRAQTWGRLAGAVHFEVIR